MYFEEYSAQICRTVPCIESAERLYLFYASLLHTMLRLCIAVQQPRGCAMRGRREFHMPVLFIEAPQGIGPDSKRKMMQKLTEAVDEAYHIGDTLIFLREYPAESVAMDGRLQSENPRILEALKRIRSGT